MSSKTDIVNLKVHDRNRERLNNYVQITCFSWKNVLKQRGEI